MAGAECVRIEADGVVCRANHKLFKYSIPAYPKPIHSLGGLCRRTSE
jgi:hypothetical protein